MFGLQKTTVDDLVTVLAAVMIFNSLPQFQFIGSYFQQYPMLVFGIALVLIVFRSKIASTIGD